jgi:DNA-binding HxlR family transcriptional regulator
LVSRHTTTVKNVNSPPKTAVGTRTLSGPAGCEESLRHCDAALVRAFGFLGKRWSGVILGTLANGESGFADLKRRVEGISDSVLSDRLAELQGAGLIVRSVESGPPVSVSYALSESGQALMPAMFELSEWATMNLPEAD